MLWLRKFPHIYLPHMSVERYMYIWKKEVQSVKRNKENKRKLGYKKKGMRTKSNVDQNKEGM